MSDFEMLSIVLMILSIVVTILIAYINQSKKYGGVGMYLILSIVTGIYLILSSVRDLKERMIYSFRQSY